MEFIPTFAKDAVSVLEVRGVQLFVHLGFSESERAKKQEVIADINIFFSKEPRATVTDQLNDTICYHTLINDLRAFVLEKQFAMVEKLSADIFDFLQNRLDPQLKIYLGITKTHPPVDGLLGGVKYNKWSS